MTAWIIVAALGSVVLVLSAFLARMLWRLSKAEAQQQFEQLQRETQSVMQRGMQMGRALTVLGLKQRPAKADEFTLRVPKSIVGQAEEWEIRWRTNKRGGLEIVYSKRKSPHISG